MADAFVGTTGNASTFHVTALDLYVRWYLARNHTFRQVATVHPVDPAHNYKTVTLTMYGELPFDTSTISETVNPDSIDIAATRQVSVTMNEYGKTVKRTLLGDATSWNRTLPADIVTMLTENAATTMDRLARAALDGATNVGYVNAGNYTLTDPTLGSYDELNATAIAAARSRLQARRARPKMGSNYLGIIHPDVQFDILREAGANTWHSPHVNVDTSAIYAGVVGTYAGVDFLVTDQVNVVDADPGGGVTNLYTSYFLADEALLEATAIEPHIVVGEQIDPMKRIQPVSWHALTGFSIFRQNSIELVKTVSGLGAAAINPGTYDPKA